MGLILAYEVPNQKRSRRGIERVCGESGAVIWVAVVGDGKPMLCVVVTRGWVGWVQQQHILKKEGQQLERKVQAAVQAGLWVTLVGRRDGACQVGPSRVAVWSSVEELEEVLGSCACLGGRRNAGLTTTGEDRKRKLRRTD